MLAPALLAPMRFARAPATPQSGAAQPARGHSHPASSRALHSWFGWSCIHLCNQIVGGEEELWLRAAAELPLPRGAPGGSKVGGSVGIGLPLKRRCDRRVHPGLERAQEREERHSELRLRDLIPAVRDAC